MLICYECLLLLYKIVCTVSGAFRKYDYGKIRNFFKYGQLSPPDYNLWNIETPVAIYHAKNDWFSAVVVSKLENLIMYLQEISKQKEISCELYILI